MTKTEIAKNLGTLKPKTDGEGKLLIDEICELINFLYDKNLEELDLEGLDSIDSFAEKASNVGGSIPASVNPYLHRMHAKLSEGARKQVRDAVLDSMQTTKKKNAIGVIVVLSVITGIVLAFGALSAFGIIPAVWCNAIGVLDCVFGLSFFIYEYSDDKLNVAKINAGDAETIKKYCKGSGDIYNIGNGVVNNGKARNITINNTVGVEARFNAEEIEARKRFIDKLFK